MEKLDEFIKPSESRAPSRFHPVHERGETSWSPGCEASSLIIQADHIWEDLTCLSKVYKSENNEYTKKLILKYVVVELRSLIEIVDRIQTHVIKTPVFDPKEKQGWREITQEEKDKTRSLFKEYSKAKSEVERLIIDIRNQIGAHRGNINWQDVMKFWDSITPDITNPILATIHPALEHARELDLYEWNRRTERGTIQVIGSQLRPEYFEELDET